MDAAITTIKAALPGLYGLALVGYISLLLGQKRVDGLVGRMSSALLFATVLLHSGYSVLLGLSHGHHPMATIFQIFSFMALSLALIYLWIEHREGNRSTGAFVLPFVTVLQTVSAVGIDPALPIHPILKSTPFGAHTGSITLGYVSFFLSTIYALMLLLFYRAMRKKKFGVLFEKLPPLNSLARMNLRTAVVGLVFFTPGIVFGLFWAWQKIPQFWADPKIYLTFSVWLSFAIVVAGHFLLKWNDRRVAITTILAFGVMTIVTVVYHTLLGGWHRFIE